MPQKNPKAYSGTASVHLSNILLILANEVGSAAAALREYLDNGWDAGATELVVALHPDRIEIFDNGHGMLPKMLPEQYELLKLYKADISEGKAPDEDVRDLMTPAGGCNFTWLMECIGFSRKRPEKGDRAIGMRGIGQLAFIHIGNTPTWYSKPAKHLAEEYYGVGTAAAKDPPIGVLHSPTADAIRKSDLSYNSEQTISTQLVDPFGVEYESGTKIVITGLVSEIATVLRPSLLAEEFRRRYGGEIRDKKLRIRIIDNLTREGRKVPDGKVITVEPLSFRGIHLFTEVFTLRGEDFKVEFYYDSSARGQKIAIRRMGVGNFESEESLTSLPGLAVEPFNSGKLLGYVELPNLPEKVFPLNNAKTLPIESPAQKEFVNLLRGLRRRLEETIAEKEAEATNKSTSAAMRQLSDLAMQAIKEVPELSNLVVTKKPTGTRPTVSPVIPTSISAIVFDEHSRGVADVEVMLAHNGKTLKKMKTSARGSASFGRWDAGVYTIQMVVPKDMSLPQHYESVWGPNRTTDENPGFTARFHLVTGKPKPPEKERREINGKIQITTRPLDDKTQMYSTERLDKGQVEINSESVEYRKALESGDENLRDSIVMSCVAMAIVEFSLQDHSELDRGQIAMALSAKLFRMRRGSKSR